MLIFNPNILAEAYNTNHQITGLRQYQKATEVARDELIEKANRKIGESMEHLQYASFALKRGSIENGRYFIGRSDECTKEAREFRDLAAERENAVESFKDQIDFLTGNVLYLENEDFGDLMTEDERARSYLGQSI
jgi:hypothetical protein